MGDGRLGHDWVRVMDGGAILFDWGWAGIWSARVRWRCGVGHDGVWVVRGWKIWWCYKLVRWW